VTSSSAPLDFKSSASWGVAPSISTAVTQPLVK
jgi:hypothetical protein